MTILSVLSHGQVIHESFNIPDNIKLIQYTHHNKVLNTDELRYIQRQYKRKPNLPLIDPFTLYYMMKNGKIYKTEVNPIVSEGGKSILDMAMLFDDSVAGFTMGVFQGVMGRNVYAPKVKTKLSVVLADIARQQHGPITVHQFSCRGGYNLRSKSRAKKEDVSELAHYMERVNVNDDFPALPLTAINGLMPNRDYWVDDSVSKLKMLAKQMNPILRVSKRKRSMTKSKTKTKSKTSTRSYKRVRHSVLNKTKRAPSKPSKGISVASVAPIVPLSNKSNQMNVVVSDPMSIIKTPSNRTLQNMMDVDISAKVSSNKTN